MIAFVALTLLIATVILVGGGFFIKWLGRIPFYWKSTPANTFCIIVTDEDESGDGMKGGGPIVTALHAVRGHRLDKTHIDPMNWEFIANEEDPEHDSFLFRRLGVQSMGSIYYTARLNVDNRMRFAREKKTEDEKKSGEVKTTATEMPKTVTKVIHTHNVFYSGELAIPIKEADTSDKLGLDVELVFTFRRRYPVRSVLRLADASTFLLNLVEEIVNNLTVSKPSGEYIGGDETRENREKLVKAVEESDVDFKKKTLDEIGFDIEKVTLRDV